MNSEVSRCTVDYRVVEQRAFLLRQKRSEESDELARSRRCATIPGGRLQRASLPNFQRYLFKLLHKIHIVGRLLPMRPVLNLNEAPPYTKVEFIAARSLYGILYYARKFFSEQQREPQQGRLFVRPISDVAAWLTTAE